MRVRRPRLPNEIRSSSLAHTTLGACAAFGVLVHVVACGEPAAADPVVASPPRADDRTPEEGREAGATAKADTDCLPFVAGSGGTQCVLACDGAVRCYDHKRSELPLPSVAARQIAVARGPSGTPSLLFQRTDGSYARVELATARDPKGPTVVDVTGLPAASKAMGGGDSHFCVLGEDDRVVCLGRNDRGNLGVAVDDLLSSETPLPVAALDGVSSLSVGGFSTCGLHGTSVRCVGDVDTKEIATDVAHLALGGHEAETSACVIHRDGSVVCTGLVDFATGSPVSPPSGAFVAVAVSFESACALDAAGAVRCWGKEYDDGASAWVDPTPTNAPPFRKLFASLRNYCGVAANGDVLCWGEPSAHWQSTPTKL